MRKVVATTVALIMCLCATAASATVYRNATKGVAIKVSRPPAASASTGPPLVSRGARPIPRTRSPFAPIAAVAPRAKPSALQSTSAPLLANFNGVSSLDSAQTNFGQQFEPPDPGLCSGNGFVLEMVNSAYSVYRTDGTKVVGPFNVNDPFDEGAKEFTSDPRCQYDKATKRWFATVLFLNSSFTAGRIDIAVSQTSDPTGLWNNYQIDATTGFNGTGCPCFGDQPRLGIDPFNLYISTDEFSIQGSTAFGTQLYAVSKSDLVGGATTAHFFHFGNLSAGGTGAFGVQPAITSGTPTAEYFMNSLDPNGTFDNRLVVWAMTNRENIAGGVRPVLSSTVTSSESYAIPPGAEQKGASSLLDAGDDRMQQTQYSRGRIWGELDTSVTIAGDPEARAAAAWFEVVPRLSSGGGTIASATVAHQGYVAVKGNSVLYPALQATPNGEAVMVATLSGPFRFPSAAFTTMAPGSGSFGPIQVADAGRTSYDPNATRWGDYSWAVVDPSGTSVWLATEYVPPASSQTVDQARNWGTRVLDVSTGP